jgi:large subunit ribosomal protein L31
MVGGPDVGRQEGDPLNKHPNLHLVEVRCTSCGASFATRSTGDGAIVVDVCSSCHPAYTGRERQVSSGSRVERFNRRRALAAQ